MPLTTSFAAFAVDNDKLYVIGGSSDPSYAPSSAVWVYNGQQRTWSPGTALPTAVLLANAAAVNGKVYVLGGHNGRILDIVQVLDVATGVWTAGPRLPTPRRDGAAVALNGEVYLIGGTSDGGTASRSVTVLDPSKGTWRIAANMPAGRSLTTAAVSGGHIYVFGGFTGCAGCVHNNTWSYDPATDVWTALAPLPTAMMGARAVTDSSGKVLVAGGSTYSTQVSTTWVFDPGTGRWSAGANLARARREAAAGLVAGSLVMAGGFDGALLSSTETLSTAASDAPWSVMARASGEVNALTLALDLTVAGNDVGSVGSLFLVAHGPQPNGSGLWLVNDGRSWQHWTGGAISAYFSGNLSAKYTIPVVQAVDSRALAGVEIYAGYGRSAEDMLARGQVVLAHTFTDDGTSGNGKAITQEVMPSAQSKTVQAGTVAVTVPGGLLTQPTTLSVQTLADIATPKPLPEMTTVGVYTIQLGNKTELEKPVTLEFSFDPAALGDGAAEGKNLWVAYWDETRQVWSRMEAEVDTAGHKLRVNTWHLSTWWIYRLHGYDYLPKGYRGPFEVYFNPRLVNPRTDVQGQSMQGLAQDVLYALETARSNFASAGFQVPTVQTSVFLANVDSSNWGILGGAIDLRLGDMVTLDEIKTDSAHELFHAIQNESYFVGGMIGRRWLVEGTPDFMAYEYGWNRGVKDAVLPLDVAWFETSMFAYSDDNHAYRMGNFFNYLRAQKGVSVKSLWDYTVLWWLNTPQAVRSGVTQQTGSTFDAVWDDFVHDAMFGSAALGKTATSFLVKQSQSDVQVSLNLNPNYTVTGRNINVEACSKFGETRNVLIRLIGNLPAGVKAELWQINKIGTALEASRLGTLLPGSQTYPSFSSVAGKNVVALIFNNTSNQVPVTLAVSATGCSENQATHAVSFSSVQVIPGDWTASNVSLSGARLSRTVGKITQTLDLTWNVPSGALSQSGVFATFSGKAVAKQVYHNSVHGDQPEKPNFALNLGPAVGGLQLTTAPPIGITHDPAITNFSVPWTYDDQAKTAQAELTLVLYGSDGEGSNGVPSIRGAQLEISFGSFSVMWKTADWL